jgi:ribosomal-protein-alanine N-acetyltransferase
MDQDSINAHRTFVDFPVLSSPRLLLRAVTPEDASALVEISYYDGIPAASEEQALEMLQKINSDYEQGNSIHWGICPNGQTEVAGTCGYYRGYKNNIGEIGYILRSKYRGKGIMTESVRLIVEFGLRDMKLNRVVAYTEKSNTGSINILKRLEFNEAKSENEYLKFSIRLVPAEF